MCSSLCKSSSFRHGPCCCAMLSKTCASNPLADHCLSARGQNLARSRLSSTQGSATTSRLATPLTTFPPLRCNTLCRAPLTVKDFFKARPASPAADQPPQQPTAKRRLGAGKGKPVKAAKRQATFPTATQASHIDLSSPPSSPGTINRHVTGGANCNWMACPAQTLRMCVVGLLYPEASSCEL